MSQIREFKRYNLKFKTSTKSAHGVWAKKEGLIFMEKSESGVSSFGEVGLVPGFSKHSLGDLIDEAKVWVWGGRIERYKFIQPALSCLKSDLWNQDLNHQTEVKYAKMFHDFGEINEPNLTIKKKIGLEDVKIEIKKITSWFEKMPVSTRVRLDANESLNYEKLLRWMDALYENPKLDFIEQPLSGIPDDKLLKLVDENDFPVALDESIFALGNPSKLLDMGWSGFFVLKPSLLEDWDETIDFIKHNANKSVVSTVYESPFGFEALSRVCRFSNLVSGVDRSIFVGNALEIESHHSDPLLVPSASIEELEILWDKF